MGIAAIGRKWFGKRKPDIVGVDQWSNQNSSSTWTDGGAVAQAMAPAMKALQETLERVVADNASAAVSEYLGDAEVAIRADPSGEPIIGLKVQNSEAALIVEIPLRKLIVGALSEMRPTLGVDPEAQAALSALINLGQSLANLAPASPQRAPVVESVPVPAARPRRISASTGMQQAIIEAATGR